MLYDKVVKEFLQRNTDNKVGIPYQEESSMIDDKKIICSIYKANTFSGYYIQVTVVIDGVYDFTKYSYLSGDCTVKEVQRQSLLASTLKALKAFENVKKLIVKELIGLKLRNILSVSYSSNLVIYYIGLDKKMHSYIMKDRDLHLNLPDESLVRIKQKMNRFGIKVFRSAKREETSNDGPITITRESV